MEMVQEGGEGGEGGGVLDAGGVGVSGAKHQVEESAQRCAESVI